MIQAKGFATSRENGTLVESWLTEIRKRIPEGSSITATLQQKPEAGFLASFRLATEDEILSSEARAETPDEAVRQAGEGICCHLPELSLWRESNAPGRRVERAS